MSGEISAARAHPAVVGSIVVAAFAVAACALVAIAWMLGWVGPSASPPTPASIASPAGQVAGTAPGVALLPGETLVTEESPARAPPCANCGTVESIRELRDGREVRVRFDDGSRRPIPSRDRRLQPGDRVHLENGRLARD
jgi:hypothetical protein